MTKNKKKKRKKKCPNSPKGFKKALFFFFFCFFRATPVVYGGSQARGRIGATAAGLTHRETRGLSHVCDLYHRSRQRWIHDPLSKARDRTCILIDTSRIHFHCATTGTPKYIFKLLFYLIRNGLTGEWQCRGWSHLTDVRELCALSCGCGRSPSLLLPQEAQNPEHKLKQQLPVTHLLIRASTQG